MGVKRGRIELFHDDQLMVALPDLKIIASTLERFGVRLGPVDERPVLGPALVQGLANVDTAVSELLNGGAAAGTVPGHRSARQALAELLSRDLDQPGCGIRSNDPVRARAPAGTPHA